MAFDKPNRVARFAGTSSTETANSAEPSSGKKDTGWLLNEAPPSSFFNWLHYRMYQWFRWLDERAFDGATSADFTIKAPAPAATSDDGGDLLLEAGVAGSDADKNGGGVELSGGDATGSGFSVVSIKAATSGAAGAAARIAEDYFVCDGSAGINGRLRSTKPLEIIGEAASTEGAIIHGDATLTASSHAVAASGKQSSPVKSSLRVNSQSPDPTSGTTGSVSSHSLSGHLTHYNFFGSPARFQNVDPLIKTLLADSGDIASTAAEVLFVTGVTIPANTLRVGSVIKVRAYGEAGITASPTLTIRVRVNGTAGPKILEASKVLGAACDWLVESLVTIRSITAAGTFVATGSAFFDESPISGTHMVLSTGSASYVQAIDTTAANVISVTGQWSASSPSNAARMISWTVEVI